MVEQRLQNPFARVFWISGLVAVFALAGFVAIFVSPLVVFGALVGVALAWALLYRPTRALGILLAVMPFQFLPITLGKFYGFEHMSALSICTKEAPLLLLAIALLQRNGFRPVLADWFAGAFFTVALVRSAFGGFFMGFADDVVFLIPYLVGRVAVLDQAQERLWVRRAVWITAVLSVVGIGELLFLGEEPRRLLLAVALTEEDLSGLHAGGYEGLRASSTMGGPLAFGALCMIALILWWVYSRNPIPAGIVFAGLVCSLTRSAWAGTFVAISVLALRLGQKRRFLKFGMASAVLFLVAIPLLEIRDFVSMSTTGQDNSVQGHVASLRKGVAYVLDHPLGSGGGSVGFRATKDNALLENIDSVYLTYGANYGVLAILSFGGFLVSAFCAVWKQRSQMGYAALGILVGFAIMMMFEPTRTGTQLNSWVWIPVGLSLRSVQETRA